MKRASKKKLYTASPNCLYCAEPLKKSGRIIKRDDNDWLVLVWVCLTPRCPNFHKVVRKVEE